MNWEILLKHINKETNTEENRQVEDWLDEQAERQDLLAYLQKRKDQLQQPLKQSDIHDQWVYLLDRIFETKEKNKKSGSINLYGLMGIAASILLVSLLSWFYFNAAHHIGSNQSLTFATPANKRGRLTLPDGSEVYMAPDSKITYTNAFDVNKRELHLTGEAFFNVHHNPQKPFIIYTENNLSVTVLGTSFNVYSRKAHNTEIKVATGLVGIIANKHTCFLKAGQQLSYKGNNQPLMTNAVVYNDAAALKNETLFFKNNNADQIAEKLQRWYNIKVVVMPSARKHPRFSGEMKDTGIDNLMQGLGYATGLTYQYTKTHTILLF